MFANCYKFKKKKIADKKKMINLGDKIIPPIDELNGCCQPKLQVNGGGVH